MSSINVANYIIEYAERHDYKLTNAKLQKILYYVYGYYNAVFFKHLTYEDFEAWKYGPILKSAYIEYCAHGSLEITCFNMNKKYPPENFSTKERTVIDYVLDQKLPMNLGELIQAVTSEEPWLCHKGEVEDKPYITYMKMYEYFSKLPDVKMLKDEIEPEEINEETQKEMTNYQWMHSLNHEELAEYLLNPWDCNLCPEGIERMDNPLRKQDRCSQNCLKHCQDWLQEKRKEQK